MRCIQNYIDQCHIANETAQQENEAKMKKLEVQFYDRDKPFY